MPNVPKTRVIAIVISDLHLSHTPPRARAKEKSWYAAMGRMLAQLRKEDDICGYMVPMIYAGDIFHTHNPPVELVNWAIQNLPNGWAIPGQHDLPHHNLEEIHKSAFGTLIEAKTVKYLKPGVVHDFDFSKLIVQGFPWGVPIKFKPSPQAQNNWIKLAVIHRYVWSGEARYHEAPEDRELVYYTRKLQGFDAAVFGDNHRHFIGKAGRCNVFNSGCALQRRTDERPYTPGYGLLMSDGTWRRKEFDISADVWAEDSPDSDFEGGADFSAFLEVFQNQKGVEFDLAETVNLFLEKSGQKVTDDARNRIIAVLNKYKKG